MKPRYSLPAPPFWKMRVFHYVDDLKLLMHQVVLREWPRQ
ncbi:Unknown protein sequence [Pseudomonas amygdali pv. myricae]|nr:Unknown protein sequence [Pseudomonas amygdali pv. myricae]